METTKHNHAGECACWGGMHFSLFQAILAIVILAIVFWAGVQYGQFRAFIGEGWGSTGGMRGNYGYRVQMMPAGSLQAMPAWDLEGQDPSAGTTASPTTFTVQGK